MRARLRSVPPSFVIASRSETTSSRVNGNVGGEVIFGGLIPQNPRRRGSASDSLTAAVNRSPSQPAPFQNRQTARRRSSFFAAEMGESFQRSRNRRSHSTSN